MSTQMSSRERTLALIVGVILAIFINLLLVKFFLGHRQRLTEELSAKKSEMEALQVLFSEKEMWEQRGAWLEAKQPKLTQESNAGVQLHDRVQELAKKHVVLLESPVLGAAERRPNQTAVTFTFETKSPWPALIAFLHEAQSPEAFTVFESANIQKDPGDPTQMRGKFKVARWYAPK
jgi:hypothetical protein